MSPSGGRSSSATTPKFPPPDRGADWAAPTERSCGSAARPSNPTFSESDGFEPLRSRGSRCGRREVLAVGLVWLAWLGAILLTVTIGLASGAYTFAQGWSIHHGLWPLFAWDYNWYHFVAYGGYPAGQGGRQYAFFPLWPELLRWSGKIRRGRGRRAGVGGKSAAFFGLSEGPPRARLRTALALACWPGSFVLTLAYPDAPRSPRRHGRRRSRSAAGC